MIAEPLVRTFIPPVPVRERALRLVKPRPHPIDLTIPCLVAILGRETTRLRGEEERKTALSDLQPGDTAYLTRAAISQDVDTGAYLLCLDARPAFLARPGYDLEVRRTREGYLVNVPRATHFPEEECPFGGHRCATAPISPYRMGTWRA